MTQILFPKLSYELTGLCFNVHKQLGRFCREKQYADMFKSLLKKNNINYKREYEISNVNGILGNKVDFLIDDKIILDFKAKKFVTKEDYYQMLRYLESASLELGMIINFRNTYLKPKRVLNSKFYNSGNSGYSGRI